MTKPKTELKLTGTYERHPKDHYKSIFKMSHYIKNQGPEIANLYEFSASIDNYENGKMNLWDLGKLLSDIFPIPKTFEEDIIIANEKNREGIFSIVYTYYTNGNFELCLSEPKTKLRLLGTYERDPSDKTESEIIITKFQLNDNPLQDYNTNFRTWSKDGGEVIIRNANLNEIVFSLCNLNFEPSSLVQGKPFNNMCQAKSRYYNRWDIKSSYDSEDLIAFFYPDGSVKITDHTERYEDWGTDYDTSPSCRDYFAHGNYIFSEKSTDGEIFVRINIEAPEIYAGKVIEAKINPQSFTLQIKGEKFINEKFYY
jgi:hypothetical protein